MENQEQWHHVVSVENLGGLKRNIKITYDVDGVKMALDKASDIVGKRVQIKGFRKGKAPVQLVERYYSTDVNETAKSLLTQEGFLHACFEQKFTPINEPKLEEAEFELDGTFFCNISLEIKPSVSPVGYVGLQIPKQIFNEEQLTQQAIEEIKSHYMTEVPKEEIQDGSVATVDFTAMVNDKEISSGVDQQFSIKKGQEPPFGENLFGLKAGSSLVETIRIPNGEYAGQDAVVVIKVKSIVEKLLPNDTEIVERLKLNSYEEFMNNMKQSVKAEMEQKERQANEEAVVDKLIELNEFDVPDSWIKDEEVYFSNQLGIGKDAGDDVKQYINKMAIRNVKRSFILDAIYNAEPTLQVSKEEIETVLDAEAQRHSISRLTLEKSLKDKGSYEGVIGMIKNNKVMNFILSQTTISEGPQFSTEMVNEEPHDANCNCGHDHE